MAREFSKPFYNSKEWKRCREEFIKQIPLYKRGLCNRCFNRGEHKLGEEVHHKIWLTPKNISDPSITLSFDNLELLCHECHTEEHLSKQEEKRYMFDAFGNLIAR